MNREIHLVQYLVYQKESSVKKIMNHFNLGENDFKDLVSKLNSGYKDTFSVNVINDRIFINIINYRKFSDLFSCIEKNRTDFNERSERLLFILKKLIVTNDFINISYFSNEMFVSRSTINNDINHLRKKLEDFNLRIEGVTNRGLRIIGNEFYKRIISIKHKFYDSYDLDLRTSELQNLLKQKEIEYKLNLSAKELLKSTLLTTINRIKNGLNIEYMPTAIHDDFIDEDVEKFIRMSLDSKEFKITKFDLIFASHPLDTKYLEKVKLSKENEMFLKSLFLDMISEIEKQIFIHLDFEYLFENLKLHLLYITKRLTYYFEINDLMSKEISKKFPLSFELSKVSSLAIEKKLKRRINFAEIGYLALYFEKTLNKEIDDLVEIIFVSNLGSFATELIEKEIISIVGENIKVSYVSESDFENFSRSYESIIITTLPITKFNRHIAIHISDIFDQEKLKIKLVVNELSKMVANGDLKLFFATYDDSKDYIKNVKRIANELTLVLRNNTEYTKKLIKKEQMNPTVFANGIALPHEIAQTEKIICVISIPEKSFKYQNMLINSIFLSAIPEVLENENSLLNFYNIIFNLGINTQYDAKLFNDFVCLLQVEGLIESING